MDRPRERLDCLKMKRAQLSEKMHAALRTVEQYRHELFSILEKDPSWYGSITIHHLVGQSLRITPKQSSSDAPFQFGIVLRLYDGETLHESATDDITQLIELARTLQ